MSSFLSLILKKTDCICNSALQVYTTFSLGVKLASLSFEITLPSFKIEVGLMFSLKHVSSVTYFYFKVVFTFFSNVKSFKVMPNFSQYAQNIFKTSINFITKLIINLKIHSFIIIVNIIITN